VKPTIENMEALGEVIGYAREGAYEKTWQETANAFHEVLDKMSRTLEEEKNKLREQYLKMQVAKNKLPDFVNLKR